MQSNGRGPFGKLAYARQPVYRTAWLTTAAISNWSGLKSIAFATSRITDVRDVGPASHMLQAIVPPAFSEAAETCDDVPGRHSSTLEASAVFDGPAGFGGSVVVVVVVVVVVLVVVVVGAGT
jgi:hypothetical protein